MWGEQVRAGSPGKVLEEGPSRAQERGELRGQERVHWRSGEEFGYLHRHTSAHRATEKGDARRAVEVLARTQLVDPRDDALGLVLPVRARVGPGATEIARKQLGSPRVIGAGNLR